MQYLQILSDDSISILRAALPNLQKSEQCELYWTDLPQPLVSSLPRRTVSVLFNSSIRLDSLAGADHDYEAGSAVYSALANVTPLHATHQALWATLSHDHYCEYVFQRWYNPKIPTMGQVIARSFCGSGFSGFARNAVSRLWWGIHWTRAPWRFDARLGCFEALCGDDPDFFSRTMMGKGESQLWQDCVDRQFAGNSILRIVYLATAIRIRDEIGHSTCSTISRSLSPFMNSYIVAQPSSSLSPIQLSDDLIRGFKSFAAPLFAS